MDIKFTIYATGTIITTNKLRYIAYETSAPTAEVARITEDPPHNFPHPVTMYVPNPVPHIIKIYSTPDESTGTLLSEFMYDPTYTNVEVRMPLELLVGGSGEYDPQDGDQSTPVIPSLIGWDWYPEMRSKSGTLSITEYTKGESVPGAGYDYFSLQGDDRFWGPDYVFIHFKPKISLSQPVFTYLNLYNGVREITGDETMDSTYYRKLCEIVTGGPSPVIQLLPTAMVPINTLLTFSTQRGAQKQATIKAASGELISCINGTFPAIYLGQGEVVWLMYGENGWRVCNNWEGMAKVGIQTNVEIVRPNTIIYNGGGLVDGGGNPVGLLRGLYPRVEWYVETQLPTSQVLTKATRDAGGVDLSGFWAVDDTFIWAPDYRGHGRRALPGTRGNDSDRNNNSLPGSYEADQMPRHGHFTITNDVVNSNNFPPIPDLTRPIAREWVYKGGAGAPGYYLAGAPPGAEPVAGPTSKTGGRFNNITQTWEAGEARGKNNGVIMGCYI